MATELPLSGGLTNRNTRLRLPDGREAFLRQGHPAPASLGIDRAVEWQLYRQAAAAGLSPACHYADPPRGLLLIDWCAEPSWAEAPPPQAQAIPALARVLAVLHRFAVPPVQMAVRAHAARYRRQLAVLPSWLSALERPLLASREPDECWLACHHDLSPANLLGPRPWVVDWEYGAAGHPGFELASILRTHGWSEEEGDALEACYRAAGGSCFELNFRPFLPWVDYIALLWALVRRGEGEDPAIEAWIARYRQRLE
ncbi:choline/ethanolamine kinase family protein [Aeromonas simiae]|uniref:choline/ethanolamine kinase family protein n=1 Tax=Aeromonas simiae TaxID=218936 RepID=UPI0005AA4157|nr:phosphotransferase [Aeromonas simiae]MDO2953624.1 choline kinase family protein [Aeromonas simiae]